MRYPAPPGATACLARVILGLGASREWMGEDVAIDILPAQEGTSFYATLTNHRGVGVSGLSHRRMMADAPGAARGCVNFVFHSHAA